MNILIGSQAPWCKSSFGIQTKHMLNYLSQLGHNLAVHAHVGLTGGTLRWENTTIYPGPGLDNESLGFCAKHFGADVVMILQDSWSLRDLSKGKVFWNNLNCPWAVWLMTEGHPCPEPTLEIGKRTDIPLTFSRFCQNTCHSSGIESTYVPLGIDTQIFNPEDKIEVRKRLGLPEGIFLVTMCSANNAFPSRKAFPENLQAFAEFSHKHLEARLFLLTTLRPMSGDGYAIDRMIKDLGIREESVIIAPQPELKMGFLSDNLVADIFRASDVLLHASNAESLGLPILESQSCGTAVVATDYSAMPEVVCNGILAEVERLEWTPGGYWQAVPNVDSIIEGLNSIYDRDHAYNEKQRIEGIDFVEDNFSWEVISKKYYKPFLESIQHFTHNRKDNLCIPGWNS